MLNATDDKDIQDLLKKIEYNHWLFMTKTETDLMNAVKVRNAQEVKRLINQGEDVTFSNEYNPAALITAIQHQKSMKKTKHQQRI